MKTLLVLRHAKSDRDTRADSDHERPLAERGRRDAKRLGRFMAENGLVPDRVLCSTALRTVDTWRRASRSGRFEEVPTTQTAALYGASADTICEIVRAEDDSARRLLVVGHEPSISDVVRRLTGGDLERFPTGALARIDFPEADSWADCRPGSGRLNLLVAPRGLR